MNFVLAVAAVGVAVLLFVLFWLWRPRWTSLQKTLVEKTPILSLKVEEPPKASRPDQPASGTHHSMTLYWSRANSPIEHLAVELPEPIPQTLRHR